MKYRTKVIINESREKVWAAFDSLANKRRWQPSLKSIVRKEGVTGDPGGISEHTYEENGRRYIATEYVLERREEEFFAGRYEMPRASAIIVNQFEIVDEGKTRWISHCNFTFKGYMKVTSIFSGRSIRDRTDSDMKRFKLLVETDAAASRGDK